MKASKGSSWRLCPLGDVSLSAARWGVSGVASRVSDPARAFGGSRGGAPPPGCLRLREVLGTRGGRRPRDSWLRVAGRRPHTRCPELVPQVPCQAGQRSMPRHLCGALCLAGRHSALPAGPLPRQAPPLLLALVSIAGAPAFLPRPPWAPRAALRSGVQAVRLHLSSVGLPLGRGLPPRAAARGGFPGPRAGQPGNDGSAGRAVGPVGGCGACGAPVRRASWPVGPPRRTLP